MKREELIASFLCEYVWTTLRCHTTFLILRHAVVCMSVLSSVRPSIHSNRTISFSSRLNEKYIYTLFEHILKNDRILWFKKYNIWDFESTFPFCKSTKTTNKPIYVYVVDEKRSIALPPSLCSWHLRLPSTNLTQTHTSIYT